MPIDTPQYAPSPRLMIAETPDRPPHRPYSDVGVGLLAAFGRRVQRIGRVVLSIEAFTS